MLAKAGTATLMKMVSSKHHYVYLMSSGSLVEAAERALQDADRRRKLAARVAGLERDKRDRPPATASTKVTPDGKKACSLPDEVQPRALSFSEADIPGPLVTGNHTT